MLEKTIKKFQVEPEIGKKVPSLKLEFEAFELGKEQPRITAIKARVMNLFNIFKAYNLNFDIYM